MKLFRLDLSSAPESTPATGFTLAITSSFFSACTTVLGKWTLHSISALLLSAMIFSIASLIIGLAYLPFDGNIKKLRKIPRKGWIYLGAFSVSSLAAIWFFWAGVKNIDPSLASFINRIEVLVAIMLGIIFLRERLTRGETLGAVLSIVGIVIMRLSLRLEYSYGFWLVLIGSVFFGITEFFSKKTVAYVPPILAVYMRNLFMSIVYWIILTTGDYSFEGLGQVWIGVLALAIFGPILSRMIYMMALARLELSKVAVISQTSPIFVVILSVVVLTQIPSLREIVGGILITAGCLIMVFFRQTHKNKNSLPRGK